MCGGGGGGPLSCVRHSVLTVYTEEAFSIIYKHKKSATIVVKLCINLNFVAYSVIATNNTQHVVLLK